MALYGESDVSTRKEGSTGKEVHTGDDQKEEDIGAASSGFEVVQPPEYFSSFSPLFLVCGGIFSVSKYN